jgi:hypothetical protein
MFYGKFIKPRRRLLRSDASPQKSHFLVARHIEKLNHFQFVIPAANRPAKRVGFDQNIQFLICRSAHLEPQCASGQPRPPGG